MADAIIYFCFLVITPLLFIFSWEIIRLYSTKGIIPEWSRVTSSSWNFTDDIIWKKVNLILFLSNSTISRIFLRIESFGAFWLIKPVLKFSKVRQTNREFQPPQSVWTFHRFKKWNEKKRSKIWNIFQRRVNWKNVSKNG